MKNKKRPGKTENLYIQIWRNPIFYEGLLSALTPEDWHILTGLAVFMNGEGECNPCLDRLGLILGLKSIGSVSNRIKSLEEKTYKGNPILVVKRKKKLNKKGQWQFDNNRYIINSQIISIFSLHPKTTVRRRQQMEKIQKRKEKLISSFSMDSKRKKNNITKDIY